jgi:hypothetical protein
MTRFHKNQYEKFSKYDIISLLKGTGIASYTEIISVCSSVCGQV